MNCHPERSEGSLDALLSLRGAVHRIRRFFAVFAAQNDATIRVIAVAALFVLLPAIASACPVCYGNPDSPMTKGMNSAIVFLLGIIGIVQIGFIALFIAFWRRAREQRRRFRLVRTEE